MVGIEVEEVVTEEPNLRFGRVNFRLVSVNIVHKGRLTSSRGECGHLLPTQGTVVQTLDGEILSIHSESVIEYGYHLTGSEHNHSGKVTGVKCMAGLKSCCPTNSKHCLTSATSCG